MLINTAVSLTDLQKQFLDSTEGTQLQAVRPKGVKKHTSAYQTIYGAGSGKTYKPMKCIKGRQGEGDREQSLADAQLIISQGLLL